MSILNGFRLSLNYQLKVMMLLGALEHDPW